MVVLVTGGSGYIGSLLIRRLPFERGFEGEVIRVFDNMAGDKYFSLFDLPEGAKYEFVLGDLTKAEDLRRALVDVDLVFDLAGITSVPLSFKMSEETKKVNVEGARNLLEVAMSSGVEKIVYSSSAAVYGDVNGLVDESHPCKPASPYAESKLLAEQLYLEAHRERGLGVAVLAPRALLTASPAGLGGSAQRARGRGCRQRCRCRIALRGSGARGLRGRSLLDRASALARAERLRPVLALDDGGGLPRAGDGLRRLGGARAGGRAALRGQEGAGSRGGGGAPLLAAHLALRRLARPSPLRRADPRAPAEARHGGSRRADAAARRVLRPLQPLALRPAGLGGREGCGAAARGARLGQGPALAAARAAPSAARGPLPASWRATA